MATGTLVDQSLGAYVEATSRQHKRLHVPVWRDARTDFNLLSTE